MSENERASESRREREKKRSQYDKRSIYPPNYLMLVPKEMVTLHSFTPTRPTILVIHTFITFTTGFSSRNSFLLLGFFITHSSLTHIRDCRYNYSIIQSLFYFHAYCPFFHYMLEGSNHFPLLYSTFFRLSSSKGSSRMWVFYLHTHTHTHTQKKKTYTH